MIYGKFYAKKFVHGARRCTGMHGVPPLFFLRFLW